MINYKDFLDFFKKETIVKTKINGGAKFLVPRNYYKMTKYEMKPKIAIYSRYLWDNAMYKDFYLGAYIVLQLRSTSHYIVKGFTKDDIINLNL